MTESTFPGFGAAVKRLPVPAPLLASLLADIADCAELKCTLRFLWYEAQQSGAPKRVPASALRTDGVLLEALGSEDEIERGIALAVERGALIEAGDWLLLRTPQNERAAERFGPAPGADGGRSTVRTPQRLSVVRREHWYADADGGRRVACRRGGVPLRVGGGGHTRGGCG